MNYALQALWLMAVDMGWWCFVLIPCARLGWLLGAAAGEARNREDTP